MNWIQIQGNFVTFDDKGQIVYCPPSNDPELEKLNSSIKEERWHAYSLYTSQIKSSEFFENGSIEFDFKLDKFKFALLTVSVGGCVFEINSTVPYRAYAIRKENDTKGAIDKTGEIGSVPIDKFLHFKISAEGSNVQLLINDVVVCQSNQEIRKSQIIIFLRSTNEIAIKNFRINKIKPKAFVVMQFTEEYSKLYSDVIKLICEEYGYECKRGDEYFTTGVILKDIIDAINKSSIVIADITPNNPNVFYEVGYAHALNKPTILLSDKKREKLPFDVSGFRTLFYDNTIAGKAIVEDLLKKHLDNININKQDATL